MNVRVSVIATVLNESDSIGVLLDSLASQTRPPDEVIIVDGGSTDGTLEQLQGRAQGPGLPLQVFSRPGCNISQGRNTAIQAAHYAIIAATDAGVRLERDWLEHLIAPLEAPDEVDVVGGAFVADPHTPFELSLGAVTLPTVDEIDPHTFNPSSRSVAYSRQAWEAAGGYPAWLDYCEDLLFDFGLRDVGCRFAFAPDAVVHFRPRRTLGAFFKQYYRYARGDGKADFWRYRHAVRYGTYLLAIPALLALSIWHHPLWLLALGGGLLGMLRTPWRRLRPRLGALSWQETLIALVWMPVIRWTGDVAKMLGYPVGIWWRWHHAPPGPWPKRQW